MKLYIRRDSSDILLTWESSVVNPQIYYLTGTGGCYTSQEGWNAVLKNGAVQPGYTSSFSSAEGQLRHLNQVGMGTDEAYYKALTADIPDVYATNPDPTAFGASYLASVKGYGKVNLPVTLGYNAISLPFAPQDNSLDYNIGGQLTGSNAPNNSDIILKYAKATSSFTQAWLKTSDNKWYDVANPSNLSDISIEADVGYWIKVATGNPNKEITLVGQASRLNREIPIYAGYNLVGSCYPKSSTLANCGLASSGATKGNAPQDSCIVMDFYKDGLTGYVQSWLKTDSVWYRADLPTMESTTVLTPGRGYWIKEKNDITWTYPRPY